MKKVENILVMCLLMISTAGISVSEHYCGNNRISIQINQEADPCCDDGMCCHSITKVFQLDTEYVAGDIEYIVDLGHVMDLHVLTPIALQYHTDIHPENKKYSAGESPPPGDRAIRLSSLQTFLL